MIKSCLMGCIVFCLVCRMGFDACARSHATLGTGRAGPGGWGFGEGRTTTVTRYLGANVGNDGRDAPRGGAFCLFFFAVARGAMGGGVGHQLFSLPVVVFEQR